MTPKPMSGAQYQAALDKLGVSQRGARNVIGIDERTSRRYAADGNVPPAIRKLLRVMIAHGIDPEEVAKL